MKETFSFAFNAVFPMLLLMLTGFWGKQNGYFDDCILRKLNAYTFKIGIPALMFCNVYSLNSLQDISLNIVVFTIISLLCITILGFVIAHFLSDTTNQKGVIIQNTFRSNYAVVGVSMALTLGGAEGQAISTSLQAPTIIFYNIMAVICLSIYAEKNHSSVSIRHIAVSIFSNPLIAAQFAGLLCLFLRVHIPLNPDGRLAFSLSGNFPWFYSFLNYLSRMTSPLMLILLGAQVSFSKVGILKKQLLWGTIIRLMIAPAIGFSLAFLFNRLNFILLSPAISSTLISLYGSPTPVASAVMVSEMGGDAELSRQYVVWTTTFSCFSLFLWIFLFRKIGIL